MLEAQLRTDMNAETSKILAMVQHIANGEKEEEPAEDIPPQPSANNVVQDTV